MYLSIEDRVIVLTGKLSSPRADLESRVVAAGGKVAKSVSSKTDLLVVGKEPGSKYDKAVQLGIPVLQEGELLDLLAGEQIEVLTVAEEHAEHDTPLTEIFGEIRSLLQAPPSKSRWAAIVHHVDRCAPSQVDALCEYIQGFMVQWDARIARDDIDHEFSEKMREAWYKVPAVAEQDHDIAPEFRLVPDHWMGELGQGVRSAKYSLPRALDLRDSKLSSTAIAKMLDHEDLTHLRALVLPRKKPITKKLVQTLANHPTLVSLTLGKLDAKMIAAIEASPSQSHLGVLNLSTVRHIPEIPDQEEKILSSPMCRGVHTLKLHSQRAPSEANVHRALDNDPGLLPELRTLHYTRGVDPGALRRHLEHYPESLGRLTTLELGGVMLRHRDAQSEKLWQQLTELDLPASITTLDISGVQLIAVGAYQHARTIDSVSYRDQKKVFLRHVLTQLTEGKLLKHVKTLALGIHGQEVEIIDYLEMYAPHIKRA